MIQQPASKPYHHGDLESALLVAALDLIAKGGLDALSLRAAARLVGVSHAAVYRHFPKKEHLVARIAQEGFIRLAAAMEMAAAQVAPDAVARMVATGLAYVDFAQAHPHHLRLMFGAPLGRPGDFPDMERAGQAARAVLDTRVDELREAGVFATQDPEVVAMAAWGQAHGLAMLLISGQLRSGANLRDLAEKALTLAWLRDPLVPR